MKKFLVIGTLNAITYKNVFPSLMDDKVWVGEHHINTFISDGSIEKFGNIYWYTNIGKNNRKPLNLTEHYSPEKYPHYYNYSAIEVSKVKNIPCDYYGVMGVPVTFMDKYCPEQFEIIGCPDANVIPQGWKGMSKEFVDLYYAQGGTGQNQEGKRLAHYITSNGKAIVPYKRLLIRRK